MLKLQAIYSFWLQVRDAMMSQAVFFLLCMQWCVVSGVALQCRHSFYLVVALESNDYMNCSLQKTMYVLNINRS